MSAKKVPVTKEASLFLEQAETFLLNRSSLAKYLGVHPYTISRHVETEPVFNPDQIRQMMSDGWNPFYIYSFGKVTLPGFTVEQVMRNVRGRMDSLKK